MIETFSLATGPSVTTRVHAGLLPGGHRPPAARDCIINNIHSYTRVMYELTPNAHTKKIRILPSREEGGAPALSSTDSRNGLACVH